jgi:hypothetical protein
MEMSVNESEDSATLAPYVVAVSVLGTLFCKRIDAHAPAE